MRPPDSSACGVMFNFLPNKSAPGIGGFDLRTFVATKAAVIARVSEVALASVHRTSLKTWVKVGYFF
jgi:hypothetical protein